MHLFSESLKPLYFPLLFLYGPLVPYFNDSQLTLQVLVLCLFLLQLSLLLIHGFNPLTDRFFLYHGLFLELGYLVILNIKVLL